MLTSAVSKYANDNEDKTSIFYAKKKKKNLDEKLNVHLECNFYQYLHRHSQVRAVKNDIIRLLFEHLARHIVLIRSVIACVARIYEKRRGAYMI